MGLFKKFGTATLKDTLRWEIDYTVHKPVKDLDDLDDLVAELNDEVNPELKTLRENSVLLILLSIDYLYCYE